MPETTELQDVCNVIDRAVDKMTKSRSDGGYVLGIANEVSESGERSISIEVKDTQNDFYEFQRPAKGRNHLIHATESLIGFAEKYGDPKDSLILCNDERAVLVINEGVDRGEREIVTLDFAESSEWTDLLILIDHNGQIGHPLFYRTMLGLEHALIDPDILVQMRTVKSNMTVDHESDLQEDGDRIGVVMKSTKGDELKRFPKKIRFRIPVLEQDVTDEDLWKDVECRLDIHMPTEPGKSVMFGLHCSSIKLIKRGRILEERSAIQDELESFTVLYGTHQEFKRDIGLSENHLIK